MPLLQRGTVSNQWYYSLDLKDRAKTYDEEGFETYPRSSIKVSNRFGSIQVPKQYTVTDDKHIELVVSSSVV